MPVTRKQPSGRRVRTPNIHLGEVDGANAHVKNVGTVDRILRVSSGGVLAIWAATRLSGHGPVLVWLLDIALIALGLDFVVTGIRGYCPLYKRLGWSTARSRSKH